MRISRCSSEHWARRDPLAMGLHTSNGEHLARLQAGNSEYGSASIWSDPALLLPGLGEHFGRPRSRRSDLHTFRINGASRPTFRDDIACVADSAFRPRKQAGLKFASISPDQLPQSTVVCSWGIAAMSECRAFHDRNALRSPDSLVEVPPGQVAATFFVRASSIESRRVTEMPLPAHRLFGRTWM